ncbi:MAG: hypothetical protein HZB79_07490 [Deltaproteobacteria bacterium]|nr:hypothetical protein [Deltaproteobacteria bacterium]
MFTPLIYDFEKSTEVYKITKKFLYDNNYIPELENLYLAYRGIGNVIPETTENFWSGHFFPYIDSFEELEISFNLCSMGFYKQAIVSLRSGLELGLLSVYWNLNDDGHKVIKNWLKAQEDTPRLSQIWQYLIKNKNIQLFQKRFDLKKRLLDLGYLHNYVHTKGWKHSNSIGLLKSNFQTFERKGFEIWFNSIKEIIPVLCILHLLKYPIGIIKYDYSSKFGIDVPSFGRLNECYIYRLEKVIEKDTLKFLQFIALNDNETKNILEWINSLPDITDEESEHQIIEMDKMEIASMGFEKWLEIYEKIYNPNNEKFLKRKKLLEKWAKEKGYGKPLGRG